MPVSPNYPKQPLLLLSSLPNTTLGATFAFSPFSCSSDYLMGKTFCWCKELRSDFCIYQRILSSKTLTVIFPGAFKHQGSVVRLLQIIDRLFANIHVWHICAQRQVCKGCLTSLSQTIGRGPPHKNLSCCEIFACQLLSLFWRKIAAENIENEQICKYALTGMALVENILQNQLPQVKLDL